MKTFTAFLACWLVWTPAYAHGDHEAKHGGIMSRDDELVSAELVVQKDLIVIYLESEDGSVPTSGVTGTVTVTGYQRPVQEAKLVPAGDNRLMASGLKPVRGDRVNARIRLPSGEEALVRFSVTR
jgi:hypothetical protein